MPNAKSKSPRHPQTQASTLTSASNPDTPNAPTHGIVFLRLPQVEERVGLKKSAIYGMIKANEFPKQKKLGTRVSVWIEAEIDAWQAAQIARAATVVSSDPGGR